MEKVYVFKDGNPAQMAYEALERVFCEDSSRLSALLKVNTGFQGPEASGLCTHPEVVRGLIRFLKDRNTKKIYVGDSSIVGVDSMEALKSAGILRVCKEEGVECLNLDDSGMEEREIPGGVMVTSLKMSRRALGPGGKYRRHPLPSLWLCKNGFCHTRKRCSRRIGLRLPVRHWWQADLPCRRHGSHHRYDPVSPGAY